MTLNDSLPPSFSQAKKNVWQQLGDLQTSAKNLNLAQSFKENPKRAAQFSHSACGILLDYSKNLIDENIWQKLIKLAELSELKTWQQKMLQGEIINNSEQRAVAHIALRNLQAPEFKIAGVDVMPEVRAQLDKMRNLVEAIRSGSWLGFGGQSINKIINIGIGGSELGAKMAVRALKPYTKAGIELEFVANIDSAALYQALENADAKRTLFIVCSKSFNTQETRSNADLARNWLLAQGASASDLAKHFVAVTSNTQAASEFGIGAEQQFAMWDWVGGRYSLWSSIGLALAIMIGMDCFDELLQGANAMDAHFFNADFAENLPVILGVLGVWYQSFLGAQSHAVIPYAHDLALLPEYMQQLDMESNGKSVGRDGKPCQVPTAPVVWGTAGSNGQHAYFQLLHQGTHLISSDFIIIKNSHTPLGDNNRQLLANAVAQMQALMCGQDEAATRAQLQDCDGETLENLLPFKMFSGNKPSTAIVLDKLTPYSLGALIAMYEHKIFVEGIIWNINSFDQFGVELGKLLAQTILAELDANQINTHHDSSTQALINHLLR